MKRIIPKGRRVVVTSGKYSDYNISLIAEAVEDIDIDALHDEWLTDHPDQREDYHFERYDFLAWVVARGLLLEIDVDWLEWHVDDYGSVCQEDEYTLQPWRDAITKPTETL